MKFRLVEDLNPELKQFFGSTKYKTSNVPFKKKYKRVYTFSNYFKDDKSLRHSASV